ncbi:MAG TPA: aromatic ring-hydroxylating dioxygenase subunit alpha [Pirellulales bacterium]|nr:aromatic ring-hydroxylating dioxygenase subunit alpha [Pirellulales bacterium]
MQRPRDCTFTESDWEALSPHWYPVAFSHDVGSTPLAVRLLDERIALFRLADGQVRASRDLCIHRGAPISLGTVEGNEIVCRYHGLRYDGTGACTLIPAQPGATTTRMRLHLFACREEYGLVWIRLVDDREVPFPAFDEWNDPSFVQVLPDSVDLSASAGRQVEGFLDVSHFAFIHRATFGETDNTEVPPYPVEVTPHGFRADYVSTVSNYPVHLKHLNPPGFQWRRLFEVWLPFTAKLTIFFPGGGRLCILNAASPVSARKTRMFCPICRDFDRDAPLQDSLDFNHQVFAEDKAIVETQHPEDLPLDLADEVHIRADRSSITYRKLLAEMGLGRSYTA